MSPAEPPSTTPDGDDPRLSFKERETLAALRRLANAQSQINTLEEQLARQGEQIAWDDADLTRAAANELEIEKLSHKASSRFGGGSARERLSELQAQQRLLLDRLGVASFDELRSRQESPGSAAEPVDPGFVAFTRRELTTAWEAYRQVLEMPDDEPVEVTEPPEAGNLAAPIDLTHPEAS